MRFDFSKLKSKHAHFGIAAIVVVVAAALFVFSGASAVGDMPTEESFETLGIIEMLDTDGAPGSRLGASMSDSFDNIVSLYTITVDGEVVGGFEDELTAQSVLNSVLSKYRTKNTVSVEFSRDVKVEYKRVNADTISDVAAVCSLLDPENTASPYCVGVYTTDNVEYVELISYHTEYTYDDTIYACESELISAGECGEVVTAETSVYLNGKLISTESEVVSETAPKSELIRFGTKPGDPTDSTGTYIWPCDGVISSYYGERQGSAIVSKYHKGIDIAGPTGTPIYASDGGYVEMSQTVQGYGYFILIRHDNGDKTAYAHCSKLLVKVGERVAQGELIALMGNTGNSTGPHLHFEIRRGGDKVNPLKYLP